MTTTTTYPNGQQLVSTALTPQQISIIFQNLTCGIIGINPPNYQMVRVDWQEQGQPFERSPKEDICYVACVPKDVEYSRVRDQQYTDVSNQVVEVWTYTKGWETSWVLYGTNAEDRARMIHSACFLDYFNDTLALSNLFVVNDSSEVTRFPEHFNGQWWERADFRITLYEQVTETINDGKATSVEVKLFNPDGQVADFTASTT